jgi:hypothetical protein
MDFCDGDIPWGTVGKTRHVLDFLVQTTSWIDPRAGEITMSESAFNGLAYILLACAETLERAEAESLKE